MNVGSYSVNLNDISELFKRFYIFENKSENIPQNRPRVSTNFPLNLTVAFLI